MKKTVLLLVMFMSVSMFAQDRTLCFSSQRITKKVGVYSDSHLNLCFKFTPGGENYDLAMYINGEKKGIYREERPSSKGKDGNGYSLEIFYLRNATSSGIEFYVYENYEKESTMQTDVAITQFYK
jgi:hypothetical protein